MMIFFNHFISCDKAQKLIIQSVIESLNSKDKKNLEKHILQCENCFNKQKSFKKIKEIFLKIHCSTAPDHYKEISKKTKTNRIKNQLQ